MRTVPLQNGFNIFQQSATANKKTIKGTESSKPPPVPDAKESTLGTMMKDLTSQWEELLDKGTGPHGH